MANLVHVDDDDFEGDLSIGAVIRELSTQLIEAEQEREAGAGRPVFQVAGLDVDISFVVTKSRARKGGLDLKVVRGDLEHSVTEQATQRITLHLTAASDDGLSPFDEVTPVRPRLRG